MNVPSTTLGQQAFCHFRLAEDTVVLDSHLLQKCKSKGIITSKCNGLVGNKPMRHLIQHSGRGDLPSKLRLDWSKAGFLTDSRRKRKLSLNSYVAKLESQPRFGLSASPSKNIFCCLGRHFWNLIHGQNGIVTRLPASQ